MIFDPVHYLPLLEKKIAPWSEPMERQWSERYWRTRRRWRVAPAWDLPAEFQTLRRLMGADDQGQALVSAAETLRVRFIRVEEALGPGPRFTAHHFSLVDAFFAPVFRSFNLLDRIYDAAVLADLPQIAAWRCGRGSAPRSGMRWLTTIRSA